LASSIGYQPFGGIEALSFGNGLKLTQSYTQDYLIRRQIVQDATTSILVFDRVYAFNDGINLTAITDNVDATRNENYIYTATNRLQRGNGIWGSLNWTYDLVGNRTSETLTGSTADTFNYPSTTNQLASVTQGAITLRGFTYDGAGNVTADNRSGTTTNYRYNQRGRLDELTIGSTVIADYVYDGLERMAVRTTLNMSPAGTTHYLYDLKGHLLVEADSTGQTLREYVWIDDLPLAVVSDVNTVSPNLYYVHADQVNRPLKMTDGSEAVVWNATYRPFGEIVSITGPASNNLRFPGQYFLIEDGLHYNWYRHYDPTLGRYTKADPLGLAAGLNLYTYASSTPTQNTDPTGRFGIIGGVASVVFDVFTQVATSYHSTGDFWQAARCVNLTEVAIAGFAGIAFPTLGNVAIESWRAFQAGALTGTLIAAAGGFAESIGVRTGLGELSKSNSLAVPIIPPPLPAGGENCKCR
jgi:RHS repeat-associated protein